MCLCRAPERVPPAPVRATWHATWHATWQAYLSLVPVGGLLVLDLAADWTEHWKNPSFFGARLLPAACLAWRDEAPVQAPAPWPEVAAERNDAGC